MCIRDRNSGDQRAEIITLGSTTVVYGCEGDEYFYDTLRSYLRGRGIYSVDLFVQTSESSKELERTADFSGSFQVDSLLVSSEASRKTFLAAGGTSEMCIRDSVWITPDPETAGAKRDILSNRAPVRAYEPHP